MYECEICGRTFNSAIGRGIHRGKKHDDEEIRTAIKEAIQRLADRLGKTPAASEMGQETTWSPSTIRDYFGSWNKAVDAAGLSVNKWRDVPDEELLAELTRLADELERSPKVEDMEQTGKFGSTTYSNRFGSWNDALAAAGLELNEQKDISETELLAELKDLTAELGHTPTVGEMRAQGPREPTTYLRIFGSWNEALEEAGLELNRRYEITDEELLEALRQLADRLGRTPSVEEMCTLGQFNRSPYTTRFGSWNDAVREAGLEPTVHYDASDEELLAELQRLHDKLERTPEARDMTEHGSFGIPVYSDAFGSWNDALKTAGLEPNRWYDVSDEELLAEIHRLADELGRRPTHVDLRRHGKFSSWKYQQQFGSWREALIEAGFDSPDTRDPDHLAHIVRSSWEMQIAELLLDAGVNYEYESLEFTYEDCRTYTPDFVTTQYVIEVKGRVYQNAAQKARVAMAQLEDRDYVVVGTELPADIHIAWEDRQQLRQLF